MTEQTSAVPPPAAPNYAFSKAENATISRTAKWAKALAIMFFITTAVQVVNLNILGILVDLAIGITFWKGAGFLGSVTRSEGDDVPNMLDALDQLQTAFMIRTVVTGIAAVVALVASVYMFVRYAYMFDPADVEPTVTVENAGGEEADDEEEEAEDAAPAEAAPAATGAGDAPPAAGGVGAAPAAGADPAAP